jgi:redox-regulated HSP33 family molecular chaperone
MASKRYRIATSCPQCGCSAVSNLSAEEIRERYGDVPNVEMECSACMRKYHTPMKDACPEWDAECRLQRNEG